MNILKIEWKILAIHKIEKDQQGTQLALLDFFGTVDSGISLLPCLTFNLILYY